MAVYDPALMVQGDGGWLAVAYVSFKALFAIGLWAVAVVGYLRAPLSWPERAWAFAAAALLVAALPFTDGAGFALGVACVAWNLWRARRIAARQRSPASA